MRKLIPILAACLATSGCFIAKGERAAAENGVTQFHQLLDAGRYHDIWQTAAQEFRDATPEAVLTAGLQGYHERLGNVAEARQTGWHVNYRNGVTSVDLNYDTRFAHGGGTEEFLYVIRDGQAELVNYRLRPDDMSAADVAPGPSGKPAAAAGAGK